MGARLLAAAVLASALLSACSPAGGSAACSDPSPAPQAETALLPSGLSLDRVGTTTRVTRTDGHLSVRAVTGRPIDEVTVLLQEAVTAAGYRPAGMDNEGFEAEVFFTSGTYAAGQALVRRGDCDGRWDVELVLIDQAALPPTTAAPTTAR